MSSGFEYGSPKIQALKYNMWSDHGAAESRSATQQITHFMEPESSLQYSQQPAGGPYPNPDKSSVHSHTLFPYAHSNIIFPSISRSPK